MILESKLWHEIQHQEPYCNIEFTGSDNNLDFPGLLTCRNTGDTLGYITYEAGKQILTGYKMFSLLILSTTSKKRANLLLHLDHEKGLY